MEIKTPTDTKFKNYHSQLLKHLRLKGLQPKTIEAYERAIKRIYTFFQGDIENLSQDQMLDYFDQLLLSHSWGGVKLDLYGLRFFTLHILNKPWINVPLIKPPKRKPENGKPGKPRENQRKPKTKKTKDRHLVRITLQQNQNTATDKCTINS